MLRVGLIGLGYWGPNYVRVVGEIPGAELRWACDQRQSPLEIVTDTAIRRTHDPAEVLADPEVDAVIVATPTSTHAQLTQAALDAGKHVLCEKPLALTVAECDQLAAAAAAAQRVLMVGHTFLFNPAVRHMRELIVAGELGDVLYCHSTRTGLGPIRDDVNALWDLAPHDVSTLLAVTGREVTSASATGAAYVAPGTADVVFVNLRMGGNVLAAIHVSWLDPYKARALTVIGSRRMVVFNDVSTDEKIRIFDKGADYEAVAEEARGAEFGEYRAVLRDGDIVIPKIDSSEPLKEQMRHFIDCVGSGSSPLADVEHARKVVAVLDAASQSLAHGGAPVDVRH